MFAIYILLKIKNLIFYWKQQAPIEIIYLVDVKEVMIDDKDGCIVCIVNKSFHRLKAKNNEERDEWFKTINDAWTEIVWA